MRIATRNRTAIARLVLVACLIACVSGCGLSRPQIAAARGFADATATLGRIGADEFSGLRSGIVEMNTRALALDDSAPASSYLYDRPTRLGEMRRRIEACEALAAYGTLLGSLAGGDRSDSLAKAATTLVERTDAALGDALTDEQAAAISGSISGLGGLLTAARRAHAVRTLARSFAPVLDSIAFLLERDFALGRGADGFLAAHENAARDLQLAASLVLDAPAARSATERELAARALETAHRAFERDSAVASSAARAVVALREANGRLLRELASRKPDPSSFRALAKAARELADLCRILSK